ncbi:MAG TPA: hypothetical protein VFA48_05525 [Gammaproteobacteria bacterium]|nr:hypothetical protein [Gammaproteobacteria bacterium]
MRYVAGAHVVQVPNVAEADRRRLHRKRESLLAELGHGYERYRLADKQAVH